MRNARPFERNPHLAMRCGTLARFMPAHRRRLRDDAARRLGALS